jgi:hypothetical protein
MQTTTATMISSTSRHYHILQQITKRCALPSMARVPTMLFSTAVHHRQQTWLVGQNEQQHEPCRPTIERIIDPLDLDIVSSPEVRRILAQCKNQVVATGKDQHPFFRQTQTTSSLPSDDEDGYDSDCEPMHDDWESEARDSDNDDGGSIDERRML